MNGLSPSTIFSRSLLVCALSAGLCGCAGPFSQSHKSVTWEKSSWFGVSGKQRAPEQESEEKLAEQNADSAHPFRDDEPLSVKLASAQTPSAQASAETDPSAAAAGEKPTFDAATMMLIETEFKDASPEERKQWFEELRQVPPDMVPRILRMRRLTQQATNSSTPRQAPENIPSGEAAEPFPANAESDVIAQAKLPGAPKSVPAVTGQVANPQATAKTDKQIYPASQNHLQAMAPWDPQAIDSAGALNPAGNSLTAQNIQQVNGVEPSAHTVLKTNSPAQLADYAEDSSVVRDNPAATSAITEETQRTQTQSYQEALDRLISLCEQHVAHMEPGELEEERQEYAARHAYLRMLYLMANRQERALEAIPKLPTSEQEFWQQMFWAMSNYFDTTGIPNPADRATHTVSQLSEASLRLRERANLELRNLTFCKNIDGFGIYERFERDEFRPGQPVLIYAEMRNFLSEPTTDGQYRTILKSTLEIHRAGSQSGLVTRQDFSPTEDICRNRRQDYFHSYMINIPERVTVGPHVLKLIVEDQLNRKVATYSINFTVK